MPELKPCPFCGGKAFMEAPNMHKKTCITCMNCHTSTKWDSVEKVTELWNRRVNNA